MIVVHPTARPDDIAAGLDAVLPTLIAERTRLSVVVAGPTMTTAAPSCVDGQVLEPWGANPENRERSEQAMPGDIAEVVLAAVDQAQVDAREDPFTDLAVGVQELGRLGGEGQLVVLAPGVPTAGCARLGTVGAGPVVLNPATTAEIDQRCAPLVPNLRGASVAWAGVGRGPHQMSSSASALLVDLLTTVIHDKRADSVNVTVAPAPAAPREEP